MIKGAAILFKIIISANGKYSCGDNIHISGVQEKVGYPKLIEMQLIGIELRALLSVYH